MNIEHYEARCMRVHDRRALLVQAERALVERGEDQTAVIREWLMEQIQLTPSELIIANMELREAKAGMSVPAMEQPHLTQLATVDLEMFGVDRKIVYTYARWCLEDRQYNSARALLKLADLMLEHERSELRQVSAMVSEAEEADKPNP